MGVGGGGGQGAETGITMALVRQRDSICNMSGSGGMLSHVAYYFTIVVKEKRAKMESS